MQPNEQREFVKAKIDRCVVDRLTGRGQPPKGWTVESIIGDYYETLGRVPEDALAQAVRDVMENRKYSTWPLASEFLASARRFTRVEGDTRAEPLTEMDEIVARSVLGYAYVHRRLAAGDFHLHIRALKGGWVAQLRRFLFDRACEQLRAGIRHEDIRVREDELNLEIIGWEDEVAQHRASVAGIMPETRLNAAGTKRVKDYRLAANTVRVPNPDRELISDDRMREPPPASEADYTDTPEPQRQPAIDGPIDFQKLGLEDDPKVDDDILEIPTDEEIHA